VPIITGKLYTFRAQPTSGIPVVQETGKSRKKVPQRPLGCPLRGFLHKSSKIGHFWGVFDRFLRFFGIFRPFSEVFVLWKIVIRFF
jgi:hypothetical protein